MSVLAPGNPRYIQGLYITYAYKFQSGALFHQTVFDSDVIMKVRHSCGVDRPTRVCVGQSLYKSRRPEFTYSHEPKPSRFIKSNEQRPIPTVIFTSCFQGPLFSAVALAPITVELPRCPSRFHPQTHQNYPHLYSQNPRDPRREASQCRPSTPFDS